jgi:cell wall-associated NlpC family hydrolase
MPRDRSEGWNRDGGSADIRRANDSAARPRACAASAEGSLPLSDRIRLALLVLVLIAFFAARAGGALGGVERGEPRPRAAAADTVSAEDRLVRYARRLLGVPYSYGGASPSSGFDCSGFTRFVYGHFGVTLPHYSVAQFSLGRRVSRGGLEPGDLVFFDGLGHVGLYIGHGEFIHAPHSGTTVSVDSMSGWYASRYDGARRLL